MPSAALAIDKHLLAWAFLAMEAIISNIHDIAATVWAIDVVNWRTGIYRSTVTYFCILTTFGARAGGFVSVEDKMV